MFKLFGGGYIKCNKTNYKIYLTNESEIWYIISREEE